MACPGVSVETIESTLGMHDAKVPINRLRNSLRALGFVIHGKRAAGYWIDDETKALIRSGAKVLLEC